MSIHNFVFLGCGSSLLCPLPYCHLAISLAEVADEDRTLTAEEERDVEIVLSAYGGTNTDTKVLSERLQEELELLESANVHGILESEQEVRRQRPHTIAVMLCSVIFHF